MALLTNFPLLAALFGVFMAQFLKIPITYFETKQLKWALLISTGGMPSSHSASVTALATAVGLQEGFGSSLFAIACMFAIIVMYDAKGIRWHAGEQAAVLNKLVSDFREHVKLSKMFQKSGAKEKQQQLKELLGHRPSEVFVGAVLGIAQTLFIYWLFFVL
ncbi:Acid phosphatase/vanadium-dependent haloperoxidase [Fictibacillus macauensis ZFHKF-1]|uniref:Acid phosphatase/vanadium-dependent haloperoxidase n=1 Tax=Fictibacillus macauensis ZFHKF-1 TaxID=1196324 RepID=I8AJE7_9BACL|nr:divergent PAP2 family protein [Fictibacillus macauensis]EIT85634.1 Acid phosphatase/vanadium-dependent haloperoxidase [Fictibacillus macauensis ZFHKF-1]